ncbi:uroporphyrinogen-III C-methyltransferase [Aquabacterium sp.]|uniref:uroporphyrinogen-III C-methyltransferase n=1 Tax=Aquabacterium sp. TaxID=1872578 RepID=UPI003BF55F02
MTVQPHTANWVRWAAAALCVATGCSAWVAWQAQKRVQGLEQELVRRQQDTQTRAAEANVLAKQAQELSRESAARTALLETRLAEVALQRTQVEDLIRTLSQSRDENLLADIDASLRVATQQATLTGSAEPLVTALQSADTRLSRANQPRLDNVRRAVAKDLDRVKATRIADLSALSIHLDEATRLLDEVPLLNQPTTVAPPTSGKTLTTMPKAKPGAVNQPTIAASTADASDAEPSWAQGILNWTKSAANTVWQETRTLIRLTRVNQPEGMLVSPEQGFFLRENIKLRLLNARLAILSRQTALATADLQQVSQAIPRYFDTESRKTQLLQSMVKDVVAQCQQTALPRPDDTLAALAAVSGGR